MGDMGGGSGKNAHCIGLVEVTESYACGGGDEVLSPLGSCCMPQEAGVGGVGEARGGRGRAEGSTRFSLYCIGHHSCVSAGRLLCKGIGESLL